MQPDECPGCLERVPAGVLLPCLHGVCALCAGDAARDPAPRCPTCLEAWPPGDVQRLCGLDGHATAAVSSAAEKDAQPEARAAQTAVRRALHHANRLLEAARFAWSDAQDIAAFATENERRVIADIEAAYTPAHVAVGYADRRDAFLAEARVRLAAERKAALLGAEAALALRDRAAECAARCKAAAGPAGCAGALLSLLGARLAALQARCDAYVPGLACATYFAHLRPFDVRQEMHAHLARTPLWHARWGEASHRPPIRKMTFPLLQPVAAAPDGARLVLGVRHAPTPLFASVLSCALPDLLQPVEMNDSVAIGRVGVHADGAGRLWCGYAHTLRGWAPDGRVIARFSLADLLHGTDVAHVARDICIDSMVAAPDGVLILLLRTAIQRTIVGVAPDGCRLWHRPLDRYLQDLVLVHGDVLCLHVVDVAAGGRAHHIALDAHTGEERDAPGLERLPRAVGHAWHTRAEALIPLVTPERVLAACPGIAPRVPPVARVWRACDLPRLCRNWQLPVLGAHGRIYFAERSGVIVEC